MASFTSHDLVEHLTEEASRHQESAVRAIDKLIADLTAARETVIGGSVRQTVGGSVLNSQHFQDAERSLVRFWDAASAAALAERAAEGR